jgi:hypothetical protein
VGSYQPAAETNQLIETLKRSAAALRDADVPFALAGSVACWARGGPAPYNDVDFAVREEDAERGLQALVDAGMRPERPPEGWLLKAWDEDVLVDLIWDFSGLPPVPELLERSDELSVQAQPLPVMALDDVMVSKLCAMDEHALDFAGPLAVARALREQIDWPQVRSRTAHWPYARGFLAMLEALEILEPKGMQPEPVGGTGPRVRVIGEG